MTLKHYEIRGGKSHVRINTTTHLWQLSVQHGVLQLQVLYGAGGQPLVAPLGRARPARLGGEPDLLLLLGGGGLLLGVGGGRGRVGRGVRVGGGWGSVAGEGRGEGGGTLPGGELGGRGLAGGTGEGRVGQVEAGRAGDFGDAGRTLERRKLNEMCSWRSGCKCHWLVMVYDVKTVKKLKSLRCPCCSFNG